MTTIQEKVNLFKKIWWKIGIISVLVAVLAGVVGLTMVKKTYTAKAVLFINVEKDNYQMSIYDATDRMIGRTQTVMTSDDYLDKVAELGGNRIAMQSATITTSGNQGSIEIVIKSTVKGVAQKTAEVIVGEQMITYVAEKVTDADKTVTKDNFTLVSAPKEGSATRRARVAVLAIVGFLLAYVVSYLVWLAAYDYKKKPEEKEAETPAE